MSFIPTQKSTRNRSVWLGLTILFTLVTPHFSSANPLARLLGPQTPPGREKPNLMLQTSGITDLDASESDELRGFQSRATLFFGESGFSMNASGGSRSIGNQELLLEDGTRVSNELSRVQIGGSYEDTTSAGYEWSVGGSFGSSSDDLFANASDNAIAVNFSVLTPGDSSRWLFGTFYSNNNSVRNNLPIPIIAYFYQPSEKFRLVVGLPFLSISLGERFGGTHFNATVSPGGIRTTVSHSLYGPIGVFAQWALTLDNYLHAERLDEDNRFFIEEKKISAGIRTPVFRGILLNLSGGYRYGSQYYQAENFFEDATVFEIEDSSFIEAQLLMRF